MVVTLGQQYNVGEKPTVILYTYINRHAEPPNIAKHENISAIEPYNNDILNLFWLSASHDLRLGMDGMLLALCDHGFERSG